MNSTIAEAARLLMAFLVLLLYLRTIPYLKIELDGGFMIIENVPDKEQLKIVAQLQS